MSGVREDSAVHRDVELFADAMEIAAAERAAFLARECGGDGERRARIEALIAGAGNVGEFLEPAPRDTHFSRALEFAFAPDEAEHALIGPYQLLEKIGEGGCGAVWRAEQREPLRREVALKVIKLGMDTREVIARFEAERQALALMEHPNIARVIDAGTTGMGRPFFVMELVRGIPITKFCDEHRLPLIPRLELFIQVCHAVQHAHQKGIIHRDLKPSNILVAQASPAARENGAGGTPALPKVIDFGIAKATQGRLTDATVHTALHQCMGTPAYMSPEQAAGGADIDTRSDIYSLGVLLYELLTGDTPFDRATLGRSTYDEIREVIRTRDPVWPSVRVRARTSGAGGEALRPDGMSSEQSRGVKPLPQSATAAQLRGDLDWIVMRCLEKERTRRYESAAALAGDLRRHLNHEPVSARPPGAAYLVAKIIRRHRPVFAVAAGFGVLLVAATIISTWQAVRATRAEHEQSRLRAAAQQAQAREAALRRRAEAQELAARQRAYGADLRLLQQALAVNKFGLARELLDRQRPPSGAQDLRGWEWRYLWQFCQSDAEAVLCRKPSPITFLSASPDGQWLAVSVSGAPDLSLRHLPTGSETALPGGGAFTCSAFSPTAPLLAFAARDTNRPAPQPVVRLWHLTERRLVGEMALATEGARMAFSRDGATLVTSGTGSASEIALWRVTDGRKLAAIPAPTDGVRGAHTPLAVSADLSVAAVATIPPTGIRLLNLATGETRWTREAAKERVVSLALSPDGRTLASGAGWSEPTIRVWDVDTGGEIGRLEGQRSFTRELAFFADGRHLASVSGDQTVRVWDVIDRRLANTLRGHGNEVFSVALMPDQRTIVSGDKDGTVLQWDGMATPARAAAAVLPKPVVAWSFAPGGHAVISVDPAGRVERWSGSGAQSDLMLQLPPNERPAGADRDWSHWGKNCRFAANRPLLATGSPNGEVCVWDWERGERVARFQAAGGAALPKSFLRDGATLAVQTGDRLAEWDWALGRELRGFALPPRTGAVAFSPDGQRVMTSPGSPAAAAELRVWQFADGSSIRLTRDASIPTWSPDGRFVAVSGPGNAVSLWDGSSYAEGARLSRFTLAVESLAFSPDSSRLVAVCGGFDGVKLWDAVSAENVLTLEVDGSIFWQTAFSPDGRVLASSNAHSGIVHLWRAPSWEQIAAAEASAARNTDAAGGAVHR